MECKTPLADALMDDLLSKYCRDCDADKPSRAHHCRKCRRCIHRFDHHCIWIDNCVGYYNQGHFIRLVYGATLLCIESTVLLGYALMYLLHGAEDDYTFIEVIILGSMLIFLVPTTTILSMLCYNQTDLLINNRTTVENLSYLDDKDLGVEKTNPYDLGWLTNVKQILGDNPWLWVVPKDMKPKGNYELADPYHF
ncbi:Palmitoyltransferase [Boothiomyces sp. JEL0866]|nr:Palmitoyltransferase [Boothiomyces sp. JEL0866]KAJ3324799.1 Palmitoyltransferase [Boothiomyces sp. JEL0866]